MLQIYIDVLMNGHAYMYKRDKKKEEIKNNETRDKR